MPFWSWEIHAAPLRAQWLLSRMEMRLNLCPLFQAPCLEPWGQLDKYWARMSKNSTNILEREAPGIGVGLSKQRVHDGHS